MASQTTQRADRIVRLIFPAILAALASPIMSGMITAYNLGLGDDFLARWLEAWVISFPIALIVVYVVSPLARGVTAHLVKTALAAAQVGSKRPA